LFIETIDPAILAKQPLTWINWDTRRRKEFGFLRRVGAPAARSGFARASRQRLPIFAELKDLKINRLQSAFSCPAPEKTWDAMKQMGVEKDIR
jgi:hypothetical protein